MKNWVKKGKHSRLLYLSVVSFVLLLFITAENRKGGDSAFFSTAKAYLAEKAAGQVLAAHLPLFAFAQAADAPATPGGALSASVLKELPIYGYYTGRKGAYVAYEDGATGELLLQEGNGEELEDRQEDGAATDTDMMEKMAQENRTQQLGQQESAPELPAPEPPPGAGQPFVPHEKTNSYDWESLKDYATLVSTFYAIDANTMMGSEQLDLEKLTAKDMTISKNDPSPQILIYHTHSREAFADSVPGDKSQTVIGVGDRLAGILTEQYGYGVLHHTVEYDTVRDDAYSKSLPSLEKLLEENPSVEVVIDLHRDAGAPGVHRAVEIDGKSTATFMLFNGVSRTKKTGDITYLKNPNLADNLAFSFQMQVKAGEYYPGLTRKIYLKGYRYNMHLKPRYLLIELGDENNTVEEALNTCGPLAHILDMVLTGEG